jgi:competence protein ComGF
MRTLYTFLFVLVFTTISIGQSFTLPELIKMSKMNVDDFDTYVTAKGFVFLNLEEIFYKLIIK